MFNHKRQLKSKKMEDTIDIFTKREILLKIVFGCLNYSFIFIPLVLLPLSGFEDIKNYTIFSGIEHLISYTIYNTISGAFYYKDEERILLPLISFHFLLFVLFFILSLFFSQIRQDYLILLFICTFSNLIWQYGEEYKYKYAPYKHEKASILYTVLAIICVIILLCFKIEIWKVIILSLILPNIFYMVFVLGNKTFIETFKRLFKTFDLNFLKESFLNEFSDNLLETTSVGAKILFDYRLASLHPELFSIYQLSLLVCYNFNGPLFAILGLFKGWIKKHKINKIGKEYIQSKNLFQVISIFLFLSILLYLKFIEKFSEDAVLIALLVSLITYFRFVNFILEPIAIYNNRRNRTILIFTLFSIFIFLVRGFGQNLFYVLLAELLLYIGAWKNLIWFGVDNN